MTELTKENETSTTKEPLVNYEKLTAFGAGESAANPTENAFPACGENSRGGVGVVVASPSTGVAIYSDERLENPQKNSTASGGDIHPDWTPEKLIRIPDGERVVTPPLTATCGGSNCPVCDAARAEKEVLLKDVSFEQRLCGLINEYSMENSSDTPDFVLAGYVMNCLTAFNLATHRREYFYGRRCGSEKAKGATA